MRPTLVSLITVGFCQDFQGIPFPLSNLIDGSVANSSKRTYRQSLLTLKKFLVAKSNEKGIIPS